MKTFYKSSIGLNRPAKFFAPALAIFLVLLLIPDYALSQGGHEHHGGKTTQPDSDRVDEKPMEHHQHDDGGGHEHHGSKTTRPGSEYRVDEKPMEHHHHDDGGGDLFRTRGAHGDLGTKKPEVVQEEGLLARGHNIYLHMCVFCHGKDGNGGGTATDYLYPWPRDFRKGIFKFSSTPTNTLPRDEDLYRTIIKGVPGTAMPAWGDALSPKDTWALVNLIKSFSPRFSKETQGEKIKANNPPPSRW